MAVLYTAIVDSIGGREGTIKSADGALDIQITKPVEMDGPGGLANPEMLFAAAYGACYGGALKYVAEKQGLEIPFEVQAKVSLNLEGANMFLSVQLLVKALGQDRTKVENIAKTAHNACPYSKAVKGNVEVTIMVEV